MVGRVPNIGEAMRNNNEELEEVEGGQVGLDYYIIVCWMQCVECRRKLCLAFSYVYGENKEKEKGQSRNLETTNRQT